MAILMLARHGQASFLAENYDRLSALGVQQAARLGEIWAGRNLSFARVLTGPLERQKDTAAEVAKAFWREGVAFPKPEVMPEFAEYDGDGVMRVGLPLLLARDEQVRRHHAAFQAATSAHERHATFQHVFELVQAAWARNEVAASELETWQAFSARVNAGLNRVMQDHQSGRVAVFTSGGPIAIAMQRALNLSTARTLEASWMSRNASWSEFLFSRQQQNRFTLSTFNAYAHLDDPAMLTYR